MPVTRVIVIVSGDDEDFPTGPGDDLVDMLSTWSEDMSSVSELAEAIEETIAFVVVRSGTTIGAPELDRLCLDNIARFKRPKGYRFVAALPKNNYGKILKTDLRALLQSEGRASEYLSIFRDKRMKRIFVRVWEEFGTLGGALLLHRECACARHARVLVMRHRIVSLMLNRISPAHSRGRGPAFRWDRDEWDGCNVHGRWEIDSAVNGERTCSKCLFTFLPDGGG